MTFTNSSLTLPRKIIVPVRAAVGATAEDADGFRVTYIDTTS